VDGSIRLTGAGSDVSAVGAPLDGQDRTRVSEQLQYNLVAVRRQDVNDADAADREPLAIGRVIDGSAMERGPQRLKPLHRHFGQAGSF
jgi:hypothetical protein